MLKWSQTNQSASDCFWAIRIKTNSSNRPVNEIKKRHKLGLMNSRRINYHMGEIYSSSRGKVSLFILSELGNLTCFELKENKTTHGTIAKAQYLYVPVIPRTGHVTSFHMLWVPVTVRFNQIGWVLKKYGKIFWEKKQWTYYFVYQSHHPRQVFLSCAVRTAGSSAGVRAGARNARALRQQGELRLNYVR